MAIYTFVCLAQNQVASLVDIQEFSGDAYRGHALRLLREHASAVTVEVWRDEAVLEVIDRQGLRTRSAQTDPVDTAQDHAGTTRRSLDQSPVNGGVGGGWTGGTVPSA